MVEMIFVSFIFFDSFVFIISIILRNLIRFFFKKKKKIKRSKKEKNVFLGWVVYFGGKEFFLFLENREKDDGLFFLGIFRILLYINLNYFYFIYFLKEYF